MRRRRPFKAGWGWTGLAAYVLGYDSWALKTHHDTLTEVFRRAAQHPTRRRRWPVVLTVGVTVSHLFGWIPRRVDPFHQFAEILKRVDVSAANLYDLVLPRSALTINEAQPWGVSA